MYNKGHTDLKIDIDKIKALPYQREDIPDLDTWSDARVYPKSIITDSICSDKSAENLNLDWSWTYYVWTIGKYVPCRFTNCHRHT